MCLRQSLLYVCHGSNCVKHGEAELEYNALSTSEAEYYVCQCGVDIIYHSSLMQELGFEQAKPTVLREDNMHMACIYTTSKPETSLISQLMYHKLELEARHINIRVYRLQEMCKDANVPTELVSKIATIDQIADILTRFTQTSI